MIDCLSFRRALSALVLSLLLALPWQARAQAERYSIDPVHTRLVFFIDHLGFSRAIGSFSGPQGWIEFDPDDFSRGRLEVEVDLSSLDLGDAEWNERVSGKNGFAVERYPSARFVSRSVTPQSDTRFQVQGELTLHGVTGPVAMNVTFNRLGRNPLTLKRTAGFSASALLRRSEFGIDAWSSMVDDLVELRIEVEATRDRRDDEEQN